MSKTGYTMSMIRQANKDAGQFWFSPSTLRFFDSVAGRDVHQGPGGVFFVSSEQFDARSPRLYSVREFDPETAKISTLGEFQQYKTEAEAQAAAAEAAEPECARRQESTA
jgi:hypothetical protein